MSKRSEMLGSAGCCFHAYNRGVDRSPIFFSDRDYERFSRRIEKSLSGLSLEIVAYALMPNHFHFCLRQDAPYAMSEFFRRLCDYHAKTVNFLRERSGHLFQGRYKLRPVESPETLAILTRYIHRNPVEAGLVREPEAWEFSSYPEFIGKRPCSFIRPEGIVSRLGGAAAYRDFVASPNELDSEESRGIGGSLLIE
jgi:putative transposase